MHTRRPAVFGSIPSTLLGSGSMHGGHVLHQEASHLIPRGLDDGRSWASTSYDLGLISLSEAGIIGECAVEIPAVSVSKSVVWSTITIRTWYSHWDP